MDMRNNQEKNERDAPIRQRTLDSVIQDARMKSQQQVYFCNKGVAWPGGSL